MDGGGGNRKVLEEVIVMSRWEFRIPQMSGKSGSTASYGLKIGRRGVTAELECCWDKEEITKGKGESGGDVRMVLGMTERRRNIVIHEEDILVRV